MIIDKSEPSGQPRDALDGTPLSSRSLDGHLADLLASFPPVEPDPHVWAGIAARARFASDVHHASPPTTPTPGRPGL